MGIQLQRLQRRLARTGSRAGPPVAPRLADQGRSLVAETLGLTSRAQVELGAPDDAHERQADALADRVTNDVGRTGALATEGAAARSLPAPAGNPSAAGGQPLQPEEREYFEPRLGMSLGAVRVHADATAAALACGFSARAFTLGSDVYFGENEYRPGSGEGRRLIAHELSHVAQRVATPGGGDKTVRREIAADLRHEADTPASQRTSGHLDELEGEARQQSEQAFQQATGSPALAEGVQGHASSIIEHVQRQADRLEGARANGFQDAVSDMLGSDLSSSNAGAFWRAFAGNTLWALSSLVPLIGPQLAAGGFATSAIGRILVEVLKPSGDEFAATVMNLTGAELAQWSAGGPSGPSNMPQTVAQIRAHFDQVNAKAMARLRVEAYALTLEALGSLAGQRRAVQESDLSPVALESLVKEYVMLTLFWDLHVAGGLEISDFSVKYDVAKDSAERALLQTYVLTHGAVRSPMFTVHPENALEDRSGTEGTSSALAALGGEASFADHLRSEYELVVGNLLGTLADWGASSTMSQEDVESWSTTDRLANGIFTVKFRIANKAAFAAQINHLPAVPRAPGKLEIGPYWNATMLPDEGMAMFSSADYSSLEISGQVIRGLNRLYLSFDVVDGSGQPYRPVEIVAIINPKLVV